MAAQDWTALTRLTGGAPFEVERVRLIDQGIAIEGRFEVPPLATLSADDQTFVAAFVRCHGSIKQMEQYFDVSYPRIKNRLNRIGALLPFPEVEPEPEPEAARPAPPTTANALLTRLERGELSVDDVIRQLRKEDKK